MKVCVCQQNHNAGQVEENRNKAVAFAKEALKQGAEIIVFQEELLIGYHKDAHALAEPVDGETTKAFMEVLKGTDAKIIYGLTEVCGDKYYISAPIVSADGVIDCYRKIHLWWMREENLRNESMHFSPGDRLVTFEHKGTKWGIMICYDGDFPETARAYARMGCDGVIWINCRDSRGYGECVMTYAIQNSLVMLTCCNTGLDEQGRQTCGLSNIVDCDATPLGELDTVEGFLIAEVHPEKAKELRKDNHLFTGLNTKLFYGTDY